MRLIDADKVMEEINQIGGHNLCEWETIGVKALIDRQPTVEVAKVVRCKDCEHWEATDDGISYNNKGRTDGACEMLFNVHYAQRHLTERDHYCGYGKRKTQEEGVGE